MDFSSCAVGAIRMPERWAKTDVSGNWRPWNCLTLGGTRFMTPKLRLSLLAAFVALLIVAVAGWLRKPAPTLASYTAEPVVPTVAGTQAANDTRQAVVPEMSAYDQYGQPVDGQPVGYGTVPIGTR